MTYKIGYNLKAVDLFYVPQRAVNGQALVDFLADHPIPNDWELNANFPGKMCSSLISSHHRKYISMEQKDKIVLV